MDFSGPEFPNVCEKEKMLPDPFLSLGELFDSACMYARVCACVFRYMWGVLGEFFLEDPSFGLAVSSLAMVVTLTCFLYVSSMTRVQLRTALKYLVRVRQYHSVVDQAITKAGMCQLVPAYGLLKLHPRSEEAPERTPDV